MKLILGRGRPDGVTQTDTIKDWKHLLKQDKDWIISCSQELVSRGQIVVYAYVTMPNHLHVVWEMKEPNGKEIRFVDAIIKYLLNKCISFDTRFFYLLC